MSTFRISNKGAIDHNDIKEFLLTLKDTMRRMELQLAVVGVVV